MKLLRILAGLCLWAGSLAALGWAFDRHLVAGGSIRETLAPALWNYSVGRRETVPLQFEQPLFLAVGDPIFVADEQQGLRQIGEIQQIRRQGGQAALGPAHAITAEALIYPGEPPDVTETGH